MCSFMFPQALLGRIESRTAFKRTPGRKKSPLKYAPLPRRSVLFSGGSIPSVGPAGGN